MTILYLCVSILAIKGAFGATIADAEKALQELDALSSKVQGELHATMVDQSSVLHSFVYDLEVSATQEIKNQIASVSSRIKALFENVKTVVDDVSPCQVVSENNLVTFGEVLEKKLKDCGDNLMKTGDDMLASTWNKILFDYDLHYNCNKMGLYQCKTYEKVDCVDGVIANIENAKKQMGNTTQIITAEMLNVVSGMNYPCGDMVVQEMEHYSSVILNSISSCVKYLSAAAFKPTCYLDK
ncbi:hypothetical protein TcasGA2_TC009350 [Tribolium castaneum]|uniref:Protein TsetseEP domain-containing protein n=1 Tax=Tribolium castaneum TaxID=7070 RepID=D6WRE1_TRICA|nr:PREDICTED: uncharacterized protein LOC661850 [Tribolium castaneum]EFA06466.1 hypothetical protein TcasGA2_TC009350 [Tribolium castaneum]|eukprot:XP_976400.1 PREDICTED: uncharacterized protein LOC661850 [Tribolium castaneum]